MSDGATELIARLNAAAYGISQGNGLEVWRFPITGADCRILLAALQALKSPWVACAERLPPENERVLIWYRGHRAGSGRHDSFYSLFGEISCGHWRPEGGNGNFDDRVSYWSALPKPPGGVE